MMVVAQVALMRGLRQVSMAPLVVSALVRSALPARADIASPGELVRNAAGAVIDDADVTSFIMRWDVHF